MASREQWAERVRGWQRSGLTAAEYAAEEGIHPGTLAHWKWKLRQGVRGGRVSSTRAESTSFVELTQSTTLWQASERIEVVVGDVVVRVPDVFESSTLRQVLSALRDEEEA